MSKEKMIESAATPWDMSDVPALCWLRNKGACNYYKVLVVKQDSLKAGPNCRSQSYRTASRDCEWSIDLKTWKPCTKEALTE